jgi:hypothetical protein
MSEPKKGPLSNLSPEHQDRLKKLQSEIQFDKLTLSFSIEDRDPSGRKKSAFYSVTASRGTGAEIPTMGEGGRSIGFAAEDVKLVRSLLSKHVVAATYEDAMRRGIVSKGTALEEMRAILASYDDGIARMLQNEAPISSRNVEGDAK